MIRLLAGVLWLVSGALTGYGLLMWINIPKAESAQGPLMFGLLFVLGGIGGAGLGFALLRRSRP